MPHVRHSIQWVCNLVPVATLKAQARGLLQQVWSRKKPLAALGADRLCEPQAWPIYWRNLITVGSGDLSYHGDQGVNTIHTASDIGIRLDHLSSLPLWSIHNIYIYISVYICVYLQRMDFNRLNSKWACHRIKDAPQARIVTGKYTTNWNLSVI